LQTLHINGDFYEPSLLPPTLTSLKCSSSKGIPDNIALNYLQYEIFPITLIFRSNNRSITKDKVLLEYVRDHGNKMRKITSIPSIPIDEIIFIQNEYGYQNLDIGIDLSNVQINKVTIIFESFHQKSIDHLPQLAQQFQQSYFTIMFKRFFDFDLNIIPTNIREFHFLINGSVYRARDKVSNMYEKIVNDKTSNISISKSPLMELHISTYENILINVGSLDHLNIKTLNLFSHSNYYNHPLVEGSIPNTVTKLINNDPEQQLLSIPASVQSLHLNVIPKLPNSESYIPLPTSLTELCLNVGHDDYSFLPNSITKLSIPYFHSKCSGIPTSVKELIIMKSSPESLDVIPESITKLTLESFDGKIELLPAHVKYLHLCKTDFQVTGVKCAIPPTVKYLKLNY